MDGWKFWRFPCACAAVPPQHHSTWKQMCLYWDMGWSLGSLPASLQEPPPRTLPGPCALHVLNNMALLILTHHVLIRARRFISPDVSCLSFDPKSRKGLLCCCYLSDIQMCHPESSLCLMERESSPQHQNLGDNHLITANTLGCHIKKRAFFPAFDHLLLVSLVSRLSQWPFLELAARASLQAEMAFVTCVLRVYTFIKEFCLLN